MKKIIKELGQLTDDGYVKTPIGCDAVNVFLSDGTILADFLKIVKDYMSNNSSGNNSGSDNSDGNDGTDNSNGEIITAIIDLNNHDPATCITYADNAIGKDTGSSFWDDFFWHYPVLFKDGKEVGRLKRDNFTQFEDGSEVDISSGEAGDVMIAFPRRGINIKKDESTNTITISMTKDSNNKDFSYYAHSRGETSKNVFYLGTYQGYVQNSKLKSLSGKDVSRQLKISQLRTYAQANGTNYDAMGFYQLVYLQCMYILKYKNLNSSETIGYGNTSGTSSSISNYLATGGTELNGMDYGEFKYGNDKSHVKLFGIEDIWGNGGQYIDGLICKNSTTNIFTSNVNFNDNGNGYIDQGEIKNVTGRISSVYGSNELGFIPTACEDVPGMTDFISQVYNQYFCDYVGIKKEDTYFYAGNGGMMEYCGIFNIRSFDIDYSNNVVRLMYL